MARNEQVTGTYQVTGLTRKARRRDTIRSEVRGSYRKCLTLLLLGWLVGDKLSAMGVGLSEGIACQPTNQIDPSSNPTRGNRLKSDPWVEDKFKKN